MGELSREELIKSLHSLEDENTKLKQDLDKVKKERNMIDDALLKAVDAKEKYQILLEHAVETF